jgi:hypothetical protein
MTQTHGLCKQRPRTCRQCGATFVADKPGRTYCSDGCRKAGSRYGRSYGNTMPTPLKVWRS